MGGKGRRRREKNFRAAHGGHSRLPPPPVLSQVNALPSKLRKIISFTSSQSEGSDKFAKEVKLKRKREVSGAEKTSNPNDESDPGSIGIIDGDNDGNFETTQLTYDGDSTVENKSNEKKKKKRKRKDVNDLRFEAAMENSNTRSKKQERKKKYLEARKKKHKKTEPEEDLNFLKQEKIKFGEVVQAPPKLSAFPKALKKPQDASQQRLRLQAIEAYRNRKGWVARPGIQLPAVTTSSAF